MVAADGVAPMMNTPPAMVNSDSSRAGLRPLRSPTTPTTMLPMGRAMNPAPKTTKAAIIAWVWSPCWKKVAAM